MMVIWICAMKDRKVRRSLLSKNTPVMHSSAHGCNLTINFDAYYFSSGTFLKRRETLLGTAQLNFAISSFLLDRTLFQIGNTKKWYCFVPPYMCATSMSSLNRSIR